VCHGDQGIDKAVQRFLAASRRIRTGLEVQRRRIQDGYDNAPSVLEGEPFEWVNVSDMHENDVDYYVYEMGRLRAMVKAMERPFGFPTELGEALKGVRRLGPKTQGHSGSSTHPADNDALDRVATFSAAMEFHDDGSVDYLVDPRYQHHDATIALLDVVEAFLRTKLKETIAANPPGPLDVQIKQRNDPTSR
jgi:hypothetical protein